MTNNRKLIDYCRPFISRRSLGDSDLCARGVWVTVRVVLTVMLMVSCSKDPSGEPGLREQIVLKAALPSLTTAPAASQGAAGATKAVADATAPMTFYFARADETASGIWGAYASGALSAVRTAGSGAQALTFSATQYYLNSGLKTRLMGWYPGGATSAGDPAGNGYWDASAGTVSWTIDGSQDILTAPACSGSMTSAMPAFVFKHRLAQLQFYLYAEDEKAAVRWGKLLSAVVTAQRNRASFTLADATDTDAPVVFSGEPSASFEVQQINELDAPIAKENAVRAGLPVMIEPQAAPVGLALWVTAQNRGSLMLELPARTYPAGTVVKVYLKLTSREILLEPELSIESWGSGNTHQVSTGPVADPTLSVEEWNSGTSNDVVY